MLTIPNARGNDAPAAIRLAIAEDSRDPKGQLRQTLLGALRLDESKGQLNYPNADEDSARVATLVERLVEEFIPHLERQRDQEVRVLSWILQRQARVLGLVPRARMSRFDSDVHAVRNLTNEATQDNHQQLGDESRWQQLRREALEMRPELQRALWDRIGCFQGDGNMVYALDPTLLEGGNSGESFDTNLLNSNQRAHLSQFRSVRLKPAVRPLVEQLKRLAARADEFLGAQHDKQGLISSLGKLLDALEPVGVWPDGFHRPELRRAIESFRNDDLKRQLHEAAPLLDGNAAIDLTADSNFGATRSSESFL